MVFLSMVMSMEMSMVTTWDDHDDDHGDEHVTRKSMKRKEYFQLLIQKALQSKGHIILMEI